jgi:uncharacterized protein (TIGR02466 family)
MNIQPLADITPFHPLIIKSNFKFNWNELESISNFLINTTPTETELEQSGGLSSALNPKAPHMLPEFSEFYKWLHPMINHIITKEWGYDSNLNYSVVQSWVNVHEKGGVTLEHSHGGAIMVVTAYLNLPTDAGFIEFKDPLEYQKSFHQREKLGWEWNEFKAVTGDVICFPGWIKHRTQPSNSNEQRWVLTSNIGIIGKK